MWPAVPGDPGLAFGYNKTEVPLGPATPNVIDRHERCCVWPVAYLGGVRDRRIVLAITAGISGRKVAHQDGRSETTVRGRYRASWGIISRGLDRARQIEACKARNIRPLDR